MKRIISDIIWLVIMSLVGGFFINKTVLSFIDGNYFMFGSMLLIDMCIVIDIIMFKIIDFMKGE